MFANDKSIFYLIKLYQIIADQINAIQRGTIIVNLIELDTKGEKNSKGEKCEKHDPQDLDHEICEKELRFNLGLPNNITRYWNFTSRVFNTFDPHLFFKDDVLSIDGSVRNPVSIPFTELWTVSNT